jgi:hypothetical protein
MPIFSKTTRDIFLAVKQPTLGVVHEGWFHQNILLDGHPFHFEWDFGTIQNGLVVYLELFDIDLKLIRDFRSRNNKVVLFHFGDEQGDKFDPDIYSKFDLILRNYFFKSIAAYPKISEKIIWVPNGFKTGVGPRNPSNIKPVKKRKFLSSFLGWIDNPKSYNGERQKFSSVAPACGQNLLLYSTPSFASGMSASLYGSIMESSIFAPCPAGNSPETIRLYDALESGCIPISLKYDFLDDERALLNPPFPVLDSWDELPSALENYAMLRTNQPEIVEELQKRCINWWSQIKVEKSYKVREALNRLRYSP